jgi:hypothetical protein
MNNKILTLTITLAIASSLIAGLAVSPIVGQIAEARVNLDEDGIGGSGGQSHGGEIHGGFGAHSDRNDDGSTTFSGGLGQNGGNYVGGVGAHTTCDGSGCETVGGDGLHIK